MGVPKKGKDGEMEADTRVKMLCRCELDGVMKGKDGGEDQFMRLYALNEIDAKLNHGIDWRQKLESQRGAVLATELKNNPKEFATQINLNVSNSWGVLKSIVDLCLALEEGKFLLMKDPNKEVIRLSSIPADAFDPVEVDEDGGEEQEEDEDY